MRMLKGKGSLRFLLMPKNLWRVKARSLYPNNLIFNGFSLAFCSTFSKWRRTTSHCSAWTFLYLKFSIFKMLFVVWFMFQLTFEAIWITKTNIYDEENWYTKSVVLRKRKKVIWILIVHSNTEISFWSMLIQFHVRNFTKFDDHSSALYVCMKQSSWLSSKDKVVIWRVFALAQDTEKQISITRLNECKIVWFSSVSIIWWVFSSVLVISTKLFYYSISSLLSSVFEKHPP